MQLCMVDFDIYYTDFDGYKLLTKHKTALHVSKTAYVNKKYFEETNYVLEIPATCTITHVKDDIYYLQYDKDIICYKEED